MPDEKAPIAKMKVADVTLNLTKEGHHVFLSGVTPAELALLLAEHSANAGGKCLDLDKEGKPLEGLLKEGEAVARSASAEKQRLRSKYAGNKVEAMFPGASPNLPTTFEEAIKLGPGTVLPSSKLTEVKLA